MGSLKGFLSKDFARMMSEGFLTKGYNLGALIIRIGFGGILYHNYNKEPPK